MADKKKYPSGPGLWNAQSIQTPKGVLVTGVLLRKPANPLPPQGSWWSTLKKTIRTYFLKPYKGAFYLSIDGEKHEVQTDSHGGFEACVETTSPNDLKFLERDGETPISLLHSYPHEFDFSKARYMVISDIDDTILVSKSALFFSKLWLMLFRQTAKRNFVEETEQAYRKLLKTKVPFAYVSASEYNLFSIISNFVTFHELPLGPILLRPMQRWKNVVKSKDRQTYKIDRIEQLIEQFPETRFVLFGDDSQHDPQVFGQIIERHPKNIHAVYLRKTGFISDEKSSAKLEQISKEVDVYSYAQFSEIEPPINTLIDEITAGA